MARGAFTSQPIALDMVHDGCVFRESDKNQLLYSQPLLSVGGALAAHLIEMLADLIPQVWFQVIHEQE